MRTFLTADRRTFRIASGLCVATILIGLLAGLAVPAAGAGRPARRTPSRTHLPGRLRLPTRLGDGLSGRWETPAERWAALATHRTWLGPLHQLATGRIAPTTPARAPTATATGGPWRVIPTPNPLMPNGTLAADSCAGPSACVAVGGYEDRFGTGLPMAEGWDGARWTLQRAPSPAGAAWSSLFGVSCASSSACTAVGYYITAGANELLGFAERWTGTRWTLQPAPVPSRSRGAGLFAISCPLPTSCVAVGLSVTSAGVLAPLAESWNGATWHILRTQSTPGNRGAELLAISCSEAHACTAAGDYVTLAGADVTLAERWNGARWTLQITPNPSASFGTDLAGISCSSPTTCAAAGAYAVDGERDFEPLAEVWNGVTWRIQASPHLPLPQGAHGGGGVFSALSCAAPDACVAVGTYLKQSRQIALTERWDGSHWRLRPSPDPAGSLGTGLSGISCPSPAACIAAGSYPVVQSIATIEGTVQPTVTLAEVWETGRWRVQTTANRAGATVDDDLSAVSCASQRACTTVGSYTAGPNGFLTQAARWNGAAWTAEPTPAFAGSYDTALDDLSCTTTRACTAVGSYLDPAFDTFALAERWNGTRWAVQPIPRTSRNHDDMLFGVSCPADRACTAVGTGGKSQPVVQRWNGNRWSRQPSPRPAGATGSELIGVSCRPARDCTAVGEYGTKTERGLGLAERWNGIRWVIQPTPTPRGATFTELDAVSCASARSCAAVGFYQLKSGRQDALAERWNGTRWSVQPTPTPAAGAELSGISCASVRACTAVGQYFLSNGAMVMLIETWNGTRWANQPTPSQDAYDSGLAWVSCTTPRTCTAVGYYFGLTGFSLNLAITTQPARIGKRAY